MKILNIDINLLMCDIQEQLIGFMMFVYTVRSHEQPYHY